MIEGKVVAICQYGGEFIYNADGSMCYTGGDAHAIDIGHEMTFEEFKTEISSLFNIDLTNMSVKYFLPSNRRTLITISTDKDLKRMVAFNIGAMTADVYILSKVQTRIMKNIVADSGTSIVATADTVTGSKRKKTAAGGRLTRNKMRLVDSGTVDTSLVPAMDNLRNANQALIAVNEKIGERTILPDFGTVEVDVAGTADNLGQQKLISTGAIDTTIPFDASLACYDVSPNNPIDVGNDIIKGVGQEFDNVKDFRTQLCQHAIRKGFVYKFIKNESTRVTVKCNEEKCPWRIHASEVSRKQKFVIKKMNNVHTCGGGDGGDGQRRATRQWLTNYIKEKLHESPDCKPKELVKELYDEFGVTVTYSQVWRGREVAKTELINTMKETYKQLPMYCERIMESNPGSAVILSTSDNSKFRRFFVSFHASLNGFEHGCRPILFLGRIPLKSNNQCKLLTAASVDGNDAVFPVAFSVVEDESYDSWVWFLTQLKQPLSTSRTITFVSSRQKGLEQAVPQVFQDSYHSYCLHNLIEDFKAELAKEPWSQQTKDALVDDFTRSAQACTSEEFNACIESIRNVSGELADWVLTSKPENWSDAFFAGSRYDHFSSNIIDSLNTWIPIKHESSIVQMVDAIHCKLMEVMSTRQESSSAWVDTLTPSMEHKLQKEISKSRKLNVLCSSDTVFEVRGNTIYVVNTGSWECTCRRWQISGLPCTHAIAVCNRTGRSVYDFCSKYFRTEFYHFAYAAAVHPIPSLESAELNSGGDMFLSVNRRPPGRQRKRRINPNKTAPTALRLCSRCKVAGHNRATCGAIL